MNRPTFQDFVGTDDDLSAAGEYTDDDMIADCDVNIFTDQNEGHDKDDRITGDIDVEKSLFQENRL